jgi:hypothetical protein
MDLSAFVNETLNIDGVTFNIEDNQFNQYDRYAYHLTLSMVGEQDSMDPDIGERLRIDPQIQVPAFAPNKDKPVRKFIVAESGVTAGLNLTALEIEDSVSSNMRYKNTVTTGINFTITEAYSINLIDQLFLASTALDVKNWRLAPLFLELEFKAYKEDGTIVPFSEFNVRKFWKIIIVEMESSLTQVGTTHRIKAATFNTKGFLDFYYVIPMTQKIELDSGAGGLANPSFPGGAIAPAGATGSIRGFFEKLGQQLTKYYFDQRTGPAPRSTSLPFLIYSFQFCDEVGNLLINTDAYTNGRRASFANFNQNDRVFTISKGISITALLDDLISSVRIANPDRPWFLVDNGANLIKIPRVECIVTNVGYDELNNDYVRELTFVISCKQSSRAVLTREQGRDLQRPLDQRLISQRQRLRFIAANSLKKAYPYYYTGRNTEIINCNIVFQNMHIIPLPLVSTTSGTPADQSQLATVRTEIARLQNEAQRLQTLIGALQDRISRRGGNPAQRALAIQQLPIEQQNLANIQRQLAEQQQLERTILGSQNTLAIFDTGLVGRLSAIPGLDIASVVNNQASIQLRDQIQTADNNNRAALARLRRREFVEDEAPLGFEPASYTYVADPRDIANTQARSTPTNPPDDTARKYYTTILSQIYDRSMNQLTEIEMDIKGDPYWLGKTNIERETELLAFLQDASRRQYLGSASQANTANYFDYDAHFLLIFRGGQAPDENTGLLNLKQNVYFTGLYQAVTVVHKFENGLFTQKIHAVRDALLSLARLNQAGAAQIVNPPAPPPLPPSLPFLPGVPPAPPVGPGPTGP